jgi:D-glycero-alpha-D-manno-heptose 1-phosphate guanylyltransferase
MLTEAIVLAGGLGTRLQSVVADLPKSLASVANKPFLEYLLEYAKKQGIKKFVFALGYKTDQVESFVRKYLQEEEFSFSIEDQPLGTGGAIYKACHQIIGRNAIVLNADSFFAISFSGLSELHESREAECTLALKRMEKFDRYGIVEINEKNLVTGFSEKKYQDEGLINGGIYALQVQSFLQKSFQETFSFEKDYLEKEYRNKKIFGVVSNAYFIDIGVPEDYQRAQTELPEAIINY